MRWRSGILDLYCERIGPGLGAEPANVLSNLAFLVSAWASWRLAHRSSPVSRSVTALIGLMATIGIGSALFHTFATTWAGILDLAPILVFQGYFLWLYCRGVASLGSFPSALLVGGLLLAALAGRGLPHGNEWSLAYIPALIPVLGWGVYHCCTQKREPLALAAAAGVFTLALTFRTLDGVACPLFPLGTHFLWHLLNASVLFLLFRALVANGRFSTGPSPPDSGTASISEVALSPSWGQAGRTTAPGGFPDALQDQPDYTSIGVSSRPAHSLIERS